VTHVLLIDDESATRLVMHNRLKEVGYEITAVENGAQGLTLARETRFDLFLVDAGLNAGISSLEVCRRLKQMPHNSGVPLIVLGKTSAREELPRGYEAGADACLVKSDLQVLEHVLKVFLRHKRKHDELFQQIRILDDQNRRLIEDRQRAHALEHAHNGAADPAAVWRDMAPGRPDGVLIVDEEGVVRFGDRGAHEIFGGGIEGRNLGRLAPTSGLEAWVRDVHTEKREGLRFDVVSRNGRAGRSLLASVIPMVGQPGEADPGLRIVLLLDAGKRRVAAELMRLQEYTLPQREVGVLLDAARVAYGPASLIGPSSAMTQVRAQITDTSRLQSPVLIVGETGSGRQHAARALHFSSEVEGPFVPVACAGFSPEHLEAEIFGQVKGAFADAILDRPGALQQASHGTVFLQDVENLPLHLQGKLARAIRDHAAARAGSDRPEPIDVRLVASTSIDLAAATASRAFDAELLQLLAATVIRIAPLRDRPEDIAALTEHFLRMYGGGRPHLEVSHDAMARIHSYLWPGNVLELKSCIERACKRSLNGVIALDHLAPAVRDLPGERSMHEIVPMPASSRVSIGTHSVGMPPLSTHTLQPQLAPFGGSVSPSRPLRPGEIGEDDPISLDHYEMKCLERALQATNGDKLKAAKLLKVGKSTLYRKLKRYSIT
jgi:DNA-binding NtrC family response regulator